MKEPRIFIIILLIITVRCLSCLAQNNFHSDVIQGYELQITNITFDTITGDVYSIPLRKYGLLKSNYSVIVSATLKDDSTEFHIPGLIANRDQFGLLVKNGRNHVGDTVKIVRRTGHEKISFSSIKIIAFRGVGFSGFLKFDKRFTNFLLNTYPVTSKYYLSESSAYYFRNENHDDILP